MLFRLHADLRARTSVHENSTQPRPQVETMRRLLDSIDRGY
ncbi:hypothetical protein [Nocardia arizonensis]|nr:hypothetical protein [Nocardia arizonensis]